MAIVPKGSSFDEAAAMVFNSALTSKQKQLRYKLCGLLAFGFSLLYVFPVLIVRHLVLSSPRETVSEALLENIVAVPLMKKKMTIKLQSIDLRSYSFIRSCD
jgi:hypothetical protein